MSRDGGEGVMVISHLRIAAAGALILLLAGCAGTERPSPDGAPRGGETREQGEPLQCVPYAREQSHIQIYGDAYTWWDRAEGRYAKSFTPAAGAVMVLYNYAGPDHAHVAVVKRIVGARDIRVDHANWLNNGAVYVNNPVRDVSPDNDWSQVIVFNIPANAWGTKIYPVQGFILPVPPAPSPPAAPDKPDAIAQLLAHGENRPAASDEAGGEDDSDLADDNDEADGLAAGQ
jgi:hypothetical protein